MKKDNLAGSISYVMIIMVLSRLLSLVSVQVYMSFFGASGTLINIYSYAVSVPNIVFNCIGTALATVVIPIFAGHTARGDRDRAKSFADNIITISSALTLMLIVLGMAFAPFLVRFTDFKSTPESYSFAVMALMIMLPVMLFYGLNYIFQGMLQSLGKFGWPAFVSVPSSLIVILYVVFLGEKFGIMGLLIATFLGLALQAAILVPPLYKSGYRYSLSFQLRDSDVVEAVKMTLPVLLGVSAYQLNMFYNITMIANFQGMVTLLTYVQNIVLNMVLAFVYSITAVIYPRLTECAAVGDMEEYKKILKNITATVIAILIPVTLGLVAVRVRLLELITKWGQVTDADIINAAKLLALYAAGVIGIGIKEIFDRAFYALKNTKIPAINGFFIMAVNISLSLVLIQYIGPFGIPVAYSAASLAGAAVLLVFLRRKIGPYGSGLWMVALKSVMASLVMYAAATGTDKLVSSILSGDGVLQRMARLGVPALAGFLAYITLAWVLDIGEIKEIFRKVLRRGKRNLIEGGGL
jgi:putative peptidoglycan lipid II flippase